ncbi:putative Plasmodesmata-located protein 2 [Hibiscus syriacus]|uniref:Plasmodesmata-located protein 2 n=1 Tax=Hibiscus syriacus TaxID=106335 RepID=A0A6A3BNW2_HIBSY|nr:uncharacterized protein LOC120212120 [Hibiscus syriacus]KAE8718710.1 putative Plasmodesmata-located protein 2 [Hibiscus syriacus]
MNVSPMHPGFLEITLISAQDLHPVSKHMKTYAVVWLQHDENNKQATNVDQAGGTNPSWNHRFTFRASKKFLNSEDAAISIEVCAAAWKKDATVGSVNVLIKDILELPSKGADATGTVALPLRRPSGKSQGLLNVEVSLKLTVEDHSGSLVNGNSLCNSDVGPSASIVAAAIAKGLYTPPVTNPSEEAERIKEWTKKEREKEALERLQKEAPARSFSASFQSRKSSRSRSSKGKKSEGTKLFACLGCEIAILAAEVAVGMKVVGGGKVGRNVEIKFVI